MDPARAALNRVRDAVARAELGETTLLDLGLEPRPLVGSLLDEGVLTRALVLIDQTGAFGRVVVFPRRADGAPTLSELLQEDHRRLDDLADQACRYLHVDPLRAVAKAHEFALGMRRHVASEEAVLFPPYEAEFGLSRTSTTAVVEREHRAIHLYLERLVHAAELVAVCAEAERGEAVAEVLRVHKSITTLVEAHSEKEEHTMFPQLDERLHEAVRSETLKRLVLF